MSKPLSLRKSARHLNIPVSTFAGYVRAGHGPRHFRAGGICQFEVGDLDEWRDARTFERAQ
jgi:hypothetical protein